MSDHASRAELAPAPVDAARAWSDLIEIPTYLAMPPEKSPVFLERRVYQGSSGRVYPNPVTDAVSDDKVDRSYVGLHLENEYVRLLILPELGGRIHVGQDATNGYDFFYRQDVIKPALVGLLGPWISGGVEFNWPQHHRPSTFMPVDWSIEEGADGSRTVWLGEHEPMAAHEGHARDQAAPGDAPSSRCASGCTTGRRSSRRSCGGRTSPSRVHERLPGLLSARTSGYVADHAKRAMATFPCATAPTTASTTAGGPRRRPAADIRWSPHATIPDDLTVRKHPGAHDLHGVAPTTSSAATTTPPRPGSSTSPITTSRRARSSGRGATTSSAAPGIAT